MDFWLESRALVLLCRRAGCQHCEALETPKACWGLGQGPWVTDLNECHDVNVYIAPRVVLAKHPDLQKPYLLCLSVLYCALYGILYRSPHTDQLRLL
jgi:hypothetical protein